MTKVDNVKFNKVMDKVYLHFPDQVKLCQN